MITQLNKSRSKKSSLKVFSWSFVKRTNTGVFDAVQNDSTVPSHDRSLRSFPFHVHFWPILKSSRVKDQRKMKVNTKSRRKLWRRTVYKILSADEAR